MAYTTFARTDVESTPTAKLSSRLLPRTGPVARLAMPEPLEPPVGQTGGLSSTANLAYTYGLRASNERLRPQPSRPAPAAAPPAAGVVEEASTIIQAAARSRGVRRDAERSEKWLGDLTRSSSAKLDAKALGELGDGKRSIPGPLLGVAGRTQFARAAEEKNPPSARRPWRSRIRVGLRAKPDRVRAARASAYEEPWVPCEPPTSSLTRQIALCLPSTGLHRPPVRCGHGRARRKAHRRRASLRVLRWAKPRRRLAAPRVGA